MYFVLVFCVKSPPKLIFRLKTFWKLLPVSLLSGRREVGMGRMASDENEISPTSSYSRHLPQCKLLPRRHGNVRTNLVSQPAYQILS